MSIKLEKNKSGLLLLHRIEAIASTMQRKKSITETCFETRSDRKSSNNHHSIRFPFHWLKANNVTSK